MADSLKILLILSFPISRLSYQTTKLLTTKLPCTNIRHKIPFVKVPIDIYFWGKLSQIISQAQIPSLQISPRSLP